MKKQRQYWKTKNKCYMVDVLILYSSVPKFSFAQGLRLMLTILENENIVIHIYAD